MINFSKKLVCEINFEVYIWLTEIKYSFEI